MLQKIMSLLKQEEQSHEMRVLYACEAGSRAWGIESANSDYDIRFVYAHPRRTYERLEPLREVIEIPMRDEILDVNGWDIHQALRLLRKSNPTLIEWLYSPIIYLEHSPAIQEMRRIAQESPRSHLYYHYEHMALTHYRQYIEHRERVTIKKYLYTIRPLLMLRTLQESAGVFPASVHIESILRAVTLDEETRTHIEQLIALKRSGDELAQGAHDSVLDAFIASYLENWKPHAYHDQTDRVRINTETDALLQSVLDEE